MGRKRIYPNIPLTSEQKALLENLLPKLKRLAIKFASKYGGKHLVEADQDAFLSEACIKVAHLITSGVLDFKNPGYMGYIYLRLHDHFRQWIRLNYRIPIRAGTRCKNGEYIYNFKKKVYSLDKMRDDYRNED